MGPPSGAPTAERPPTTRRSRLPLLIAAAIAVVGVVIAAVLVANLGSDSDPDNVAQPTTLNATEATTLLQKIIPKSYGAEGYELFDDGYSSTPNRSKTGFVCIPQDDAPLPAESGKVSAQRINLIETGGARDDRPRDQLLLSASYFTPDTATTILGQIRAKINQCRDDAPTGSYVAYDYAIEEPDLEGDQVGMQTEMSSSPATIVTCQMTRIDDVILRACAVTKKDDTREPRGLGGTPLPGPERSQASADAAILDLVNKAKAVLGK